MAENKFTEAVLTFQLHFLLPGHQQENHRQVGRTHHLHQTRPSSEAGPEKPTFTRNNNEYQAHSRQLNYNVKGCAGSRRYLDIVEMQLFTVRHKSNFDW